MRTDQEDRSHSEDVFQNFSLGFWMNLARNNALSEDDLYFYSDTTSGTLLNPRNEAAALAWLLTKQKDFCGDDPAKLAELTSFCANYLERTGGPVEPVMRSAAFEDGSSEMQLLKWVTEKGAETSLLPATFPGGLRGACTSVDVLAGGQVAAIPSSLLITYDTAKESELGAILTKIPSITDDMVALIWTMAERTLPNSLYAPYWNSLPQQLTTGLSVPQEVVDLVAGTQLHVEMSSAREMLKEQFDEIEPPLRSLARAYPALLPPSCISWNSFLWAAQLWYAYAAQVMWPDNELRTSLIPLLGLLNHSPWPHCVHYSKIDPETNSLKVTSFRPIAAGEQVTLSYGHLPNSKLILFYGFVVPKNPADTFPLSFEVPDDDFHREEVLEKANLSCDHFLRNGPLPESLLAAMRVVAAQPEELEKLQELEKEGQHGDFFKQPLSEDTEVLALEALQAVLDALIEPVEEYKERREQYTNSRTANDSPAPAPNCVPASAHAGASDEAVAQFIQYLDIFVEGQLQILRCAEAEVRHLLSEAEDKAAVQLEATELDALREDRGEVKDGEAGEVAQDAEDMEKELAEIEELEAKIEEKQADSAKEIGALKTEIEDIEAEIQEEAMTLAALDAELAQLTSKS